MPKAAMRFETTINAPIERVFAYVSDLTRHGEWAANDLSIEPIGNGKFRSHAEVKGLEFDAELTVTENSMPTRFGFEGEDKTGKFSHLFEFSAENNQTKVIRHMSFDLSPKQMLMFWVLYFPVRRPAGQTAMARLKVKLEG